MRGNYTAINDISAGQLDSLEEEQMVLSCYQSTNQVMG